MLRKILKKNFCVKPATSLKKALLLPSKIPIFPFQSHVSVISNEDRDTIRKLGFYNAVSSVRKKYLEDIGQRELEIIEGSNQKFNQLVEESEKDTKEKK